VSSLKDDTDMNLLLEYLTPGLIRLTELAEQAYHRPKEANTINEYLLNGRQ